MSSLNLNSAQSERKMDCRQPLPVYFSQKTQVSCSQCNWNKIFIFHLPLSLQTSVRTNINPSYSTILTAYCNIPNRSQKHKADKTPAIMKLIYQWGERICKQMNKNTRWLSAKDFLALKNRWDRCLVQVAINT